MKYSNAYGNNERDVKQFKISAVALFGKWKKINLQRTILAKVEYVSESQISEMKNKKLEITTMRAMKYVNANYLVFYIFYIHLFIYESMNNIYISDI